MEFLYLRDDGIIISVSVCGNETKVELPDGFQQTEESIIEVQEDKKRLDKCIRDIFMNGRHMDITMILYQKFLDKHIRDILINSSNIHMTTDIGYDSHIVNVMRKIKNKNIQNNNI